MGLMIWIYVLFAAGLLNFSIAIGGLDRFLSLHKSIKTRECLDDFKRLARLQMYQALLQIAFVLPMGIAGMIGIIAGKLNFIEIVIFLALNVIDFILGTYGKSIEKKVRTLAVEDEGLAGEYLAVCEAWVKQAFPRF